ncbi:conjugal transfer protein TraD [Caulobacter sp. NIBR2454]|uniref:conjugal transfer protein TraD n=1 Tax=Caulobacter sp. NIBR2454 TaxID=3015996 RepID=UPI0022B669C0|nr:conjugal transfer protein TraD [Caulobacter sp. NIBR2454]
MRKPRDIDAELAALARRTKTLKARKVVQLGELVVSTGADTLDVETLAGALLSAVKAADGEREGWRRLGADHFRKGRQSARPGGADRGGRRSAVEGHGAHASR